MKPTIIVLCGVSHSGKTTYADKIKSFTAINSDEIRRRISGSSKPGIHENEVWSEWFKNKKSAIERKENIILDACHMTSQARWHSLNCVPRYYHKVCVIFNVDKSELMRRVKKEQRIDLDTVLQMNNDFIVPSEQELFELGFDRVLFKEQLPR